MLDTLITSKTRIKMLLKFFTNSAATAYLREMAEEFDESTNSIRHELNNLSKAGYLTSQEDGRTIRYRATGYWVLGTGRWVLGAGYWVLGPSPKGMPLAHQAPEFVLQTTDSQNPAFSPKTFGFQLLEM